VKEIGKLFGSVTFIMTILSMARYFMRIYYTSKNKNSKTKLDPKGKFMKAYRWILKNHKNFGIIAIISVLMHSVLVIKFTRISYTGIVATTFMVVQGFTGYKLVKKKGNNTTKMMHRVSSILMLVFIFIHLATNMI